MSYHVTILRTNDGRRVPITAFELEQAASSFEDMRISQSKSGPMHVDLTAHGAVQATLWHEDDEIWTKNPSREVMLAMLALADRLGARVRGDELETYRTPEDYYNHPDDERERKLAAVTSKNYVRSTRRNQFILNAAIFLTFVVLCLVAATCSER
jgi:hypothetical protein